MNLTGKVALVTGAARRIGRILALHLAKLGCHVVIHYHTSRQAAEQVATEIRQLGQDCLLVQADLSKQEEAARTVTEAWSLKGSLAILVNCAANFQRIELNDITAENWAYALETNLLGPFWLIQKAGPFMVQQGEGKIINIADISWQSPWNTRLPYCVSKAGLVSLTTGCAKFYAPQVQVNAIGPGAILFPEDYTQEQREVVISKTLLKRGGAPEDVATALEFFCRCDFVTGVFLPVDGGQSVPRI